MKKSKTSWYVGGGLVVLALALFIVPGYLPSELDDFAQCVTDSGATYYGAWWCPNCQNQNTLFGNAKKYIDYIECSGANRQQLPVCNEAGIKAYPTWEFGNGDRVEGTQTLAFLSEKTGCELPK